MASLALRIRASDDEEDPEEALLPRALAVPELSSDDDSSALPGSAEQYLLRVRKELTKQGDVVTANMEKLNISIGKQVEKQGEPRPEEAAAALRLSQAWQQQVEADFSDLRCRLTRWKARNRETLHRATKLQPAALEEGDAGASGGESRQPSLSSVAACTQRDLHALLERQLELVQRRGLSLHSGRCTFALAAALLKPLPADVCSCLRQLARHCRRARATMAEDDPLRAVASLLICLVARYFGQTDLADPC